MWIELQPKSFLFLGTSLYLKMEDHVIIDMLQCKIKWSTLESRSYHHPSIWREPPQCFTSQCTVFKDTKKSVGWNGEKGLDSLIEHLRPTQWNWRSLAMLCKTYWWGEGETEQVWSAEHNSVCLILFKGLSHPRMGPSNVISVNSLAQTILGTKHLDSV